MSGAAGSSEFRERARLEANRYGPDPWIFVRELLQNARDAGATQVHFEVEEHESLTRVTCTDDGEGMGYEHARRYLFSLYASSKEDAENQVGRFGVGFWSVLRFDPSRIVIRSHPRGDDAWEIALDGALEHARHRTPRMEHGTQVVLEKAFSDGSQVRRVHDAACQNARFLRQRDHRERPLRILINGERINADFALPAPSASFRRGPVRGVVGLGAAPRVELFSRGLRVRSAACLDDLLSSSGHTGHSRVRFPELPGALAPQALLESDGLELLLSRSDARENRSLRKLVKLATLELEHLVERQLDQVRPPGLFERIAGLRRRVMGESLLPRVTLAMTGGIVLALLAARVLWGPSEIDSPEIGLPVVAMTAPAHETANPGEGYADLASRYRGPRVSELDPSANVDPIPMTYAPASERPYFSALVVADLNGGAASIDRDARGQARPYQGSPCLENCLDVSLGLVADAGPVRIPVPTGHRLDTPSVRLDGRSVTIVRTTNDEPCLWLDEPSNGVVTYRTGAAASPDVAVPPVVGLPTDLLRQARRMRREPLQERVRSLLGVVVARVRYSTSREVAAMHHQAILDGEPFIERTVRIGAGDCDVQNGLLVALLQAADVPARLAVGYVGTAGRVAPWLHAWAEYSDVDGKWSVADASSSLLGSPGAVATGPDVTTQRIESPPGADPGEAVASHGDPSTSASAEGPSDPAVAQLGTPAKPSTSHPIAPGQSRGRWWTGLLALFGGVAGITLFVLALRGRTRRSFELDDSGDLSRLLHGALQRPAAFRHLPALFHRKLIPLVNGGALSLNRARDLAGQGRLFRSRTKQRLAQQAVRRRVDVLDDESPEARTVGDTLGATDLDRWSEQLDRARTLPVLDRVNMYLREVDERWEVRACESGSSSVTSLDLGALRVRGDARRVVLIHSRDPWLLEAEDQLAQRPAMAVLLLLDHLLERLNLAPDRRAQLLAAQARAALQEARG